MSSTRTFLILIAVAVIAGLGGWGVGRLLNQPQEGPIATPQFPEAEWVDLDGAVHRTSDWRGEPVLVNFWATWCAPCRKEMPYLNALHQDAGLNIVGIAIDRPGEVKAFLETVPVDYTIVVDDGPGMGMLAGLGNPAGALPHSVLVNADGNILMSHLGELTEADGEAMLKLLE